MWVIQVLRIITLWRNMKTIAQLLKLKTHKSKILNLTLMSTFATSFMLFATPAVHAATAVSLGQADNFAVLAGGGITNSGATTIQGDVGTYPTLSFSDTGTVTLSGTYHFGDATAIAAKTALATAYAAAAAAIPPAAATADLGGQTLFPGIYNNAAGLALHGTLTLDAQNNPSAVFIFQTAAGLSTGATSQINIINGGQACNVFWQVGSTTTLGASSDFKGNILTSSNFIGGANAHVSGRVLSLNGSVALNSDTIIKPTCAAAPTTLYVVPDNQSVAFGSPSVAITAKYETVNNNPATVVVNPSLGNTGWVAPVCAATPAYAPASVVGTSTISCTGGSGGTLYALDKTDTATLTVAKVGTKIAVTTAPSRSFFAGTTLMFSGVVSPITGTGVCTGPVSFILDRNPLTGVAGAYAVTSPAVTTGWMNGNYHLLATYAGDINCLASSNNSTGVKVGTQTSPGTNVVISGGGSYLSPSGKASFEFLIKSALLSSDTSTVTGKVTWMVPKQWKFQGTLNTYSSVNGVGTATGGGVLWFWNPAGHEGKWYPATTSATNVKVMFTVSANSNGEDSRPITSFAIGFTGTSVVGAPALPALGSLVAIGGGSKGDEQGHSNEKENGKSKGKSNGKGHND